MLVAEWSVSEIDRHFQAALSAISKIEAREWPEASKPYEFHESFTSDIQRIERFCRSRRIYGRSSKYLNSNWDTVCYLTAPYFLYYLPGILVAMLESPEGPLAKILIASRLRREADSFTKWELEAVGSVEAYLSLGGITADSERKMIDAGKVEVDRFMKQQMGL